MVNTDCDKASQELKLKLITAPVLAIPDPAAPFGLITDSCGFGIGALLMQSSRPVAFYSRKMTDPEKNYVFTLITDNKPNTYLDSQPTLSRQRARWSEYLQRFHFSWVHKPGKFNVADPLGRNPSFKTLSVVLAVATRQQTQALRPAAETVTDTVTPTFDTVADAAPAAKRRRHIDNTVEPANTEQDDTTTETDADPDTADTADIVG